jgi:hypothetical protein
MADDVDISPEAQRLLINLMLAALKAFNNRGRSELGQTGPIEEFAVNPELQRQFMSTIQAFAADNQLSGRSGSLPPSDCKGLLQALREEIKALGGIPVNTVQGWRQKFANCRGKMPEQEYNEGMSLLEPSK